MLHHHLHPFPAAQMFGQLLRQIDRAMLAASAAKRRRQALKATPLIIAHAGIHQGGDASQKLMHALLLIQVIGHGLVFAGESLEALLASGIGKASRIEDEAAAVSSLVFQRTAVE